MTAIKTDDLTKQYGELRAVDGLNLTVQSGEVFGFLGPNGAGKSTTINILLGFMSPTSGCANVLDADPTREPQAVRSRVGLLPEGCHFYENLSGRHHLVSAIETKDATDDPEELLDRVGLSQSAARRPVGGYSKGMTQRIALAIALVGRPELLILDEPSSGLDPEGIKRLREIVREERDRGTTVFFSSHHLDQVEKICSRIAIMRGGSLTTVADIETLRETVGEYTIKATVTSPPDETQLQSITGVTAVSMTDETVTVTCASETRKMRVLDELDHLTTVEEFETETTSLETLFETVATDGANADSVTDDQLTRIGGE